jgi:hypothetical protein
MSASAGEAVECLCVAAIEELHAGSEVRVRGLEEAVEVVVHLDIRVAQPPELVHRLRQQCEVEFARRVGAEDRALVASARRDVEDAVGHLDATLAGHATTVDPARSSEAPAAEEVALSAQKGSDPGQTPPV